MHQSPGNSFYGLLTALKSYWDQQGCVILEPLDQPMGAGTFHPATFLRSLGKKHWKCAYSQACRRPADGRYGDNPNRLQHYYQFQVLLKPPPDNVQDLYLQSLKALGLSLNQHDIRFVEDNWQSPTLGAWGIGWEVWLNGMEITQFTYFQQVGGIECDPVSVELTYGLERLAMYLQGRDNVFDLRWHAATDIRYGDLFRNNERQFSEYNFELADTAVLSRQFDDCEEQCRVLCGANLPLVAYEQVLQASHLFNILDARGTLSATERQSRMLRVRKLAAAIAALWHNQ